MRGFTLIESIVVIFVFSIFFLAILSTFLLGFKVLTLMERKIVAHHIAQGEIEKIRNLPYLEVGTKNAQLPYAKGILEPFEKKVINKVEYLIERRIKFISDSIDDPEDCPLDYKKVEISVSFSGILTGKVTLNADIAPASKAEEIQVCSFQPAGILRIEVINQFGEYISFPKIEILNEETQSLIDFAIPSSGRYDFPLSPGSYKVKVSKEGYSREESFKVGEEYSGKIIAMPQKSNPVVFEKELTKSTFIIDELSSLLIKTFYPSGQGIFFDSFLNEEKISEKNNVSVFEGQVSLATTSEGYLPEGYLISIPISPPDLISWQKFSFKGERPPGTNIKYQFLYFSNQNWKLIPDSELAGNSEGLEGEEIDLSHLSTTTYSSLKIKGILTTNLENFTPIIKNWTITWQNSNPIPISSVSFDLLGEKIVGKDSQENPIPKTFISTGTDLEGKVLISNLEPDNFHFINFTKNSDNLELISCFPQCPVFLSPGTTSEISLFLKSTNSLLVLAISRETSSPILAAQVKLTSFSSQIQYTNINGETIFLPLESGFYNIEVEASGFLSTSTSIFISGQTRKIFILEPSE